MYMIVWHPHGVFTINSLYNSIFVFFYTTIF